MGYIRHHAILATCWDGSDALKLKSFCEHVVGAEQVGFIGPAINGYCTVVVGPDGSKEGWPESEHGDSARKKIVDYLTASDFAWVEVQYGDESGNQFICSGSDFDRPATNRT